MLFRSKESEVEVHPRIPLVPDITVSIENLSAIVDIIHEAGADDVSLLPYNPLGNEMYVQLGEIKPRLPENFFKVDEEREIANLFQAILKEKIG